MSSVAIFIIVCGVALFLALLVDSTYDINQEWLYLSVGFVILFTMAVMVAVRIKAFVLWYMASDRRQEKLSEWARTNGFTHSASTTEALMALRCPLLEDLQKGDHRYSRNIMVRASDNRSVCAFDHHYYYYRHIPDGMPSSSGDDDWQIPGKVKSHHYFSAVVVETGIPFLPLSIRPRDVLDEVSESIGFEEVGFESAEFSRRFSVKSADRRWAYDVVHQKTMELMLTYPRFHIEFQGSQVMARRATIGCSLLQSSVRHSRW